MQVGACAAAVELIRMEASTVLAAILPICLEPLDIDASLSVDVTVAAKAQPEASYDRYKSRK